MHLLTLHAELNECSITVFSPSSLKLLQNGSLHWAEAHVGVLQRSPAANGVEIMQSLHFVILLSLSKDPTKIYLHRASNFDVISEVSPNGARYPPAARAENPLC